MMSGKRLVVIGGVAAGLSAASKARRLDNNLKITVFERSGYVSYGACGIPYYVGGMIAEAEDLLALTADTLRTKRGIDVHVHTEVTAIDREQKQVAVTSLESGETSTVGYDYLVIATGARPIIPPIQGIGNNGVFFVRNVEDAKAIRSHVEGARSAVIVGGGVIGLEMAEQIAGRSIEVTLFEALDRLLPNLPVSYSHLVADALQQNGVRLHLGKSVSSIQESGGTVVSVTDSEGSTTACDLVIVAVGVKPESDLARSAGLELGLRGAIVVDTHQQTSDPCIWAAGDCVQMRHLLSDTPVYAPLGTTANKMGRVAGSNIGGEAAQFDGVLGSIVTKVFDLYIAATGFSLEQAIAAGHDAVQHAIIKGDKASYYPGRRDCHLNVVVDTKSGRLLGAQGVGGESIAGRINVLVAAITMGMTVAQLNELDLVYTPSVAPVYDPLLIAASQAMKLARG